MFSQEERFVPLLNYYVNKCLRSRRWTLLKVTCEGEMSYQYQLVYLLC
ncbi:hypothetical protein pdam_00015208, partial [Pocillopora damicornis]